MVLWLGRGRGWLGTASGAVFWWRGRLLWLTRGRRERAEHFEGDEAASSGHHGFLGEGGRAGRGLLLGGGGGEGRVEVASAAVGIDGGLLVNCSGWVVSGWVCFDLPKEKGIDKLSITNNVPGL